MAAVEMSAPVVTGGVVEIDDETDAIAEEIVIARLAPLENPLDRPAEVIGHVQERLGVVVLHVEDDERGDFLRAPSLLEALDGFRERQLQVRVACARAALGDVEHDLLAELQLVLQQVGEHVGVNSASWWWCFRANSDGILRATITSQLQSKAWTNLKNRSRTSGGSSVA